MNEQLTCNHCGWNGTREELKSLGSIGRLHCPACYSEYGRIDGVPAPGQNAEEKDARFFRREGKGIIRFSILHPSARPDQWRKVYDDWMSKASVPSEVEYVLCVDPRWGFSSDPAAYADLPPNIHVVLNDQRRCYVDSVNIAARASTGSILIVNADDQFACQSWDTELLAVPYAHVRLEAVSGHKAGKEFVVEVSTGTEEPGGPSEHDRGIFVMPILSRSRFERLGYVFYPEYESMCADNDFCEHAKLDGVVIDARHLFFEHQHWLLKKRDPDDVDRAQNRNQAYELGKRILQKRRAQEFRNVPKRSIALCMSGERFEAIWVDSLLNLYGHLIDLDFSIFRIRANSKTNVYVMREEIRRAVLNCKEQPELCLWLDDDNPVSPEHFDRLLQGLDAHPEIDGMAGWCWIHDQNKHGFMASCGLWAPDHLHWQPFPSSFMHESEPRAFEVGGMPVILMRLSALKKAGDDCFLPVLDRRLEHGMTGEDIAFFLNAEKGGAKFMVDPQVRVPHLKYVEVEPVFPEEGRQPVKVACMMRVKNEARWIQRTIESVRELCGNNIFVMEDGSTDDTARLATEAGAIVLKSPFEGQGLDERRDKNWLLAHVKNACSPDWILMPDGDEELEAGGCDKIRRALEANPPVDCFALRFLFLWNSLDTIRVDGTYGTMLRQSLFRANSGLEFKSYYEGKDGHNHVGLHTSNAPGLGGMRVAPLNVFLLHYGYLHREDRIRKYNWILSIDPLNEAEDFYRHTVQGDIPEVGADLKLKHAGPLGLRKLPPRLVPRFDVPPAALEHSERDGRPKAEAVWSSQAAMAGAD